MIGGLNAVLQLVIRAGLSVALKSWVTMPNNVLSGFPRLENASGQAECLLMAPKVIFSSSKVVGQVSKHK